MFWLVAKALRFKCPFLQLFILVLYFKLNSSNKSMLLRMTVPPCAQSFETFHLFWYTSVYDSFKIFHFKFMFQFLKNIHYRKSFTVFDVEYTQYLILNLGLTVHIVFCFWLTCKQNLLPVGQVIIARSRHKMFWCFLYDFLDQKLVGCKISAVHSQMY